MIDGDIKKAHREAVIEILSSNERVEKAVLFGSRAMQTNNVRSDVDIALFGDNLSISDHARLTESIELIPMAQSVDLVLYRTISNPQLLKHIEKNGVVWYRRKVKDFVAP